jgi:hypothetical protein
MIAAIGLAAVAAAGSSSSDVTKVAHDLLAVTNAICVPIMRGDEGFSVEDALPRNDFLVRSEQTDTVSGARKISDFRWQRLDGISATIRLVDGALGGCTIATPQDVGEQVSRQLPAVIKASRLPLVADKADTSKFQGPGIKAALASGTTGGTRITFEEVSE